MKGTLLGGFKIQLNDGNGHPLSSLGRVRFYKAGTLAGSSEPLEVYKSAAMDVALGTVVYSDANGYLPDIWLRGDYLYDVRVERKIQEDPVTWEKWYDVLNVGHVFDEVVDSYNENLTFVQNIDDLKTVDFTKFKNVFVAGFYEAGDWGEPSLFEYDAQSTKEPNGASYVLPNSLNPQDRGRWVQIFDCTTIDVRKFGAIPDLTETPDVLANIVNCITYCINSTLFKSPISVGFLKSGNYYIGGHLDMDYYKFTFQDESTKKVGFVINNGVIFNGLIDGINVTLGQNTDVKSLSPIVAGGASLLMPEYMYRPILSGWGKNGTVGNHNMVIIGEGDSINYPSTGFSVDLEYGLLRFNGFRCGNSYFIGNELKYLEESVFVFSQSGTGAVSCGMKKPLEFRWDDYGVKISNRSVLVSTDGDYSAVMKANLFEIEDFFSVTKAKVDHNGIYTAGTLEVDGDSSIKGNLDVDKVLKINDSRTRLSSSFVPKIIKMSELHSKFGIVPTYTMLSSLEYNGYLEFNMSSLANDTNVFIGEFLVIVNDIVQYTDPTIKKIGYVKLRFASGPAYNGVSLDVGGNASPKVGLYLEDSVDLYRGDSVILMRYSGIVSGDNTYSGFTRVK